MPGVAVVGDAGGIPELADDDEFRNSPTMPPASPTTATPGMVLPYQYEDSGIGSPWVHLFMQELLSNRVSC